MQTTKTVLTDIIETLEDGRKGFESGAEKLAEDGRQDLAATFREFAEQRARFSTELRNIAVSESIDIDERGSLGGAMHRGWMALKDALTGDDPHAVIAAAEKGEDHAVSEYDEALERGFNELPATVHDVLVRQYEEVRKAHDTVKALRERTDS